MILKRTLYNHNSHFFKLLIIRSQTQKRHLHLFLINMTTNLLLQNYQNIFVVYKLFQFLRLCFHVIDSMQNKTRITSFFCYRRIVFITPRNPTTPLLMLCYEAFTSYIIYTYNLYIYMCMCVCVGGCVYDVCGCACDEVWYSNTQHTLILTHFDFSCYYQ